MKKIILVLLALLGGLVQAAPCNQPPYSVPLTQINGGANGYQCVEIDEIGEDGIAIYRQDNHDLNLIKIGSGLTYNKSTSTISVTQVAPAFNTPTRSLNTAYQISTTQIAYVSYAVDVTVSSPLLAGAQGTAFLEYADDTGFTTNVKRVVSGTNSTTGVLNLTNAGTVALSGYIPAGKYVRIRTQTVSGSPTFALRSEQQEVLF